MPTITFIEHNGAEHCINGAVGQSVMQAAVDNMVPGIMADCGGYANCATCHCYIDESGLNIPEPDEIEQSMLSCAIEPKSNSRLSCQVIITEKFEGLVVHLPASQV